MTFSFPCPGCGHANLAELTRAGQKAACGGCGKALTVPAPRETIEDGTGTPPPGALKFACPSCGRKYATKPELAGKKIRCGACGAGVRVPGGEAAPAAAGGGASAVVASTRSSIGARPGGGPAAPGRPASPAASSTAKPGSPAQGKPKAKVRADGDEPSSLLEELAEIEGVAKPKRAGAVLPSRSEAMELVRQKAAEQQVVQEEKKAEKSKKQKKKKRKHSGFFDPKDTLILVAGVGLVVGALGFLAWGYPDLRFPVGGLLCIVGFIVYLLGLAALRQLVAEEGALKVLMFRFFPPYQWWFVLTRWSDTKDFVAFLASGFVILSIGGFVINASPLGKVAQESERAYQKAKQGNEGALPQGPAGGAAPIPAGAGAPGAPAPVAAPADDDA